MSYTLEVSPISGPLGLYLLDITADDGVQHLYLETPLVVKNAGPEINPPGNIRLRLDLFRKITDKAWEFIPVSKSISVPVISAAVGTAVYERAARTPDGICIDLKDVPMRDMRTPEDYAYSLSLDGAPVVRINFTRSNSGIAGIPTVSADPLPISVLPAPYSGMARVKSQLVWKPV